jgi:4-hydroxy-2-oxoheptanedioate aldolase
MDLPKNTFKAAIAAGQQQIGLWCSIPSSALVEALANCGFDWMLIDMEHTVIDHQTVLASLQAAAPYPTHPIVRAKWNDVTEIKKLMDMGAQTILVPYVQTVAEAKAAAAAMRYAPAGMRGVAGTTRASRYGAIPDYTARANDEVCCLVQVETVAALAQIEAIAAVDGIDGLFIGPADLAASMGLPGQLGHPDVKAAILDGVRRITAAGKPAGVLTNDDAFLGDLIEAGTKFTAVDIDFALLIKGVKARAATWKA